ncbi:hypothetical protein [uncultured Cohaesibacter sp.]|uniref:hypothetical protein n=1 Tax=uncultured Cohaesibacter sp. TaxID=1002546 RepID=UPI00292D54CC|nr:hypothetical protein [uncultured Cohaesibacter sp.]
MFFIKIGTIIAWLLIVGGGLKVVMASWIAYSTATNEARIAFVHRYLGSGDTGEHIDKGLLWLTTGVVIGLIARIAKSLRR